MRPKPAQAPGYIDEPIAMVRSWGTSSDTLWYLQGNNYNVEALTDRTGAIVERYAYTPYGEPTVYTAPGTDGKWFTSDDVTASVSVKGNALTFQGRELDAETGVYYFRNRYYSAQMGRFVSRDPLGYGAGDVNLFRMESSSPMDRRDPLGLEDGSWNGHVTYIPTLQYSYSKSSDPARIGCCTGEKGTGELVKVSYSGSWWLSQFLSQGMAFEGMDQSIVDEPDETMQKLINHENAHVAITSKWELKLKGKKHKVSGTLVFCDNGNVDDSFKKAFVEMVDPLFQSTLLGWKKENNREDDKFKTPRSFPEAGI